ncbi:hypothetical protein P7C70_g5090, partial [Phenoliferia sp. Uapishka_3]
MERTAYGMTTSAFVSDRIQPADVNATPPEAFVAIYLVVLSARVGISSRHSPVRLSTRMRPLVEVHDVDQLGIAGKGGYRISQWNWARSGTSSEGCEPQYRGLGRRTSHWTHYFALHQRHLFVTMHFRTPTKERGADHRRTRRRNNKSGAPENAPQASSVGSPHLTPHVIDSDHSIDTSIRYAMPIPDALPAPACRTIADRRACQPRTTLVFPSQAPKKIGLVPGTHAGIFLKAVVGETRTAVAKTEDRRPLRVAPSVEFTDSPAEIAPHSKGSDSPVRLESEEELLPMSTSVRENLAPAMLNSEGSTTVGRIVSHLAPEPHSPNSKFHELFPAIPPEDDLIEIHRCALLNDVLLPGKLYCSEQHLSFRAHLLGLKTISSVRWDDVIAINKCTCSSSLIGLHFLPNSNSNLIALAVSAIEVTTSGSTQTFASFHHRDSTYDLLISLWQHTPPEAPLQRSLSEGSGAIERNCIEGQKAYHSNLEASICSYLSLPGPPSSSVAVAVAPSSHEKCCTSTSPASSTSNPPRYSLFVPSPIHILFIVISLLLLTNFSTLFSLHRHARALHEGDPYNKVDVAAVIWGVMNGSEDGRKQAEGSDPDAAVYTKHRPQYRLFLEELNLASSLTPAIRLSTLTQALPLLEVVRLLDPASPSSY